MGLPIQTTINVFTGNSNDITTGIVATIANTAAKQLPMPRAQMKSIQFTCANQISGNGVFGVEVSNDGINWVVYNRLIPNLAGTNSQTDAYVVAPTLSSNTSSVYLFPVGDYFNYMRVFCTVTTDGTYFATLSYAG